MAIEPRIELAIYVGNRQYAMRVWPAVPRVGEEIMLRRMAPDEEQPPFPARKIVQDEHAIAIVEAVCWGTSDKSRESLWSELRVSLFCKWRD
jgi:hypothetical protein